MARSVSLAALPAIVALLCLEACAARTVTPVAMTQPGDDQLTCSDLDGQIRANQIAAADMLQKDKGVEAKNVTVGVVFGGGLLSAMLMDLSNEEQVKARSMIDRDERLNLLARSKGCPGT